MVGHISSYDSAGSDSHSSPYREPLDNIGSDSNQALFADLCASTYVGTRLNRHEIP